MSARRKQKRFFFNRRGASRKYCPTCVLRTDLPNLCRTEPTGRAFVLETGNTTASARPLQSAAGPLADAKPSFEHLQSMPGLLRLRTRTGRRGDEGPAAADCRLQLDADVFDLSDVGMIRLSADGPMERHRRLGPSGRTVPSWIVLLDGSHRCSTSARCRRDRPQGRRGGAHEGSAGGHRRPPDRGALISLSAAADCNLFDGPLRLVAACPAAHDRQALRRQRWKRTGLGRPCGAEGQRSPCC